MQCILEKQKVSRVIISTDSQKFWCFVFVCQESWPAQTGLEIWRTLSALFPSGPFWPSSPRLSSVSLHTRTHAPLLQKPLWVSLSVWCVVMMFPECEHHQISAVWCCLEPVWRESCSETSKSLPSVSSLLLSLLFFCLEVWCLSGLCVNVFQVWGLCERKSCGGHAVMAVAVGHRHRFFLFDVRRWASVADRGSSAASGHR